MCKHFLLLLFFTLSIQGLSAQGIEKLDKPNLILFMLNISSNKLDAMKERGATKEQLNVIVDEDNQINTSIINDFKYNFNFCPIYYFYSTDYDAVKKKDWDNVTFFDAEHLTTPKQIEMNSLGNYYIVEVNYPPIPVYEEKNKDIDLRREDPTALPYNSIANARDYSLLLHKDDFSLLKGKKGVTNISLRKIGSILKPNERKYKFIGASDFQRMLNKYFKD